MGLLYLFPEADAYVGGSIHGSGPGPLYQYVDDPLGEVDEDDKLISFAQAQDGSGEVVFDLTPPAQVVLVNSVTVHCRARHDGFSGPGSLVLGVFVSNQPFYGPLQAPGTNWKWYSRGPLTKNPARGDSWTQADLDSLQLVLEGWDDSGVTNAVEIAAVYAVVDAVLVPSAVGAVRDRASRALRTQGRHTLKLGGLPLGFAAWPLLSPLAVAHFAVPPAGASLHRRDRRVGLVTGISLDLDEMQVALTLSETRRITVADFDTCYSPEDELSPAHDGVARLSRGGRTFARPSKKWVPSPLDGRIVQLYEDQEPLSRRPLCQHA